MTLQAKAIALVSLLAIGAICYAAWSYHQQQIGAAKIEARDALAALNAKQRELEEVQRNAKATQDAADALQAEKDRLVAALADPAPVIRVCSAPDGGSRLRPAATAPAKPSEAAAARGDGASVSDGTQPGPNIGAELQLIALVADRLAAQDRALLELRRAAEDRPGR